MKKTADLQTGQEVWGPTQIKVNEKVESLWGKLSKETIQRAFNKKQSSCRKKTK